MIDGWTDGLTDSPCVPQDFVTFTAAALLPLNLNHNCSSRARVPLTSYCLWAAIYCDFVTMVCVELVLYFTWCFSVNCNTKVDVSLDFDEIVEFRNQDME